MILFAAALLLHVALLLWSLAIAFEAIPPTIGVGDTAVVVPLCLVLFWTMFALWPAYTRNIAAVSGLLVASALLTPGAVFVVGLILLNAHLVGARLFAWVRRDDNSSAALPASVTTLTGICAWIGVMSITASMKFHYGPVYVAALLVPLGVWWRQALSVLSSLRQALVRPAAATRGTERAWIALLLTLLVLHLLIVAKPEVGYDANAMIPFGPKPVPEDRWFESKPLWARIFIMIAGVFMNTLLAVVVAVVVVRP